MLDKENKVILPHTPTRTSHSHHHHNPPLQALNFVGDASSTLAVDNADKTLVASVSRAMKGKNKGSSPSSYDTGKGMPLSVSRWFSKFSTHKCIVSARRELI